jgi:hypothetical protein
LYLNFFQTWKKQKQTVFKYIPAMTKYIPLLRLTAELSPNFFLDSAEETFARTVAEELDQLGNLLSLRVHSVEEKSSKISNITMEQRVPSKAP